MEQQIPETEISSSIYLPVDIPSFSHAIVNVTFLGKLRKRVELREKHTGDVFAAYRNCGGGVCRSTVIPGKDVDQSYELKLSMDGITCDNILQPDITLWKEVGPAVGGSSHNGRVSIYTRFFSSVELLDTACITIIVQVGLDPSWVTR